MFYNTGIATYIWVLNNRKSEQCLGKVQLIDATCWFKPLRKNLGKKNCELSTEDIQRIVDAFLAFEETEHSKIFPNETFGYWKVTVERPLRLKVELSAGNRARFGKACTEAKEEPLANLVDRLADTLGPGPHADFNAFLLALGDVADRHNIKLTAKRQKLVQTVLAEKDETAAPVIEKVHKPGKMKADPLHGRYLVEHASSIGKSTAGEGGRPRVVEYEPDTELRDTEQIPLLEEGGIEAFFRREVLPHVPDAWIDPSAAKIGYEISFTRYFYKPQPLRTLEQIRTDILAVEKETEGLLDEIIRRGQSLAKN
jgi:type I restriction enzyme M protein